MKALEEDPMKKTLFVMSCFAVTLAVAPACATKKFVRTEVGQVNDKVTTMGKSLEETQERVRVAEGRITEVDGKAVQAGQAAQVADKNAAAAQQTGNQAMEVGKTAIARAEAVEASTRKLIFETVLSDDKAKFAYNRSVLSDEAKAEIDAMVSQLRRRRRTSTSRSKATPTTPATPRTTSSWVSPAPRP
jgi:hypothetical protein